MHASKQANLGVLSMGWVEQCSFELSFELGLCWNIVYWIGQFIPYMTAQMGKSMLPLEPLLSCWNLKRGRNLTGRAVLNVYSRCNLSQLSLVDIVYSDVMLQASASPAIDVEVWELQRNRHSLGCGDGPHTFSVAWVRPGITRGWESTRNVRQIGFRAGCKRAEDEMCIRKGGREWEWERERERERERELENFIF